MSQDVIKALRIAARTIGLIVLLAPILYVARLLVGDSTSQYRAFVFKNYIVFFGMPYAAFFAYFLVTTVEASRGPIEVEIPGFKFKGAGGPLTFWILIFLSVLTGFKLFWHGN